ncbi:MAG: glutamate formiminotransferase / 5-formyltetrahydrofolate cyclo-ligase [Solirubrobacteraceae bacterium]|jgi:glutamate formiminotransferase/glutamate formiminotransferase/formiminotetrahydrofolate cyclodeaminase|nr:glutamate formiminotransferase / 5-formyltetrahydrofolate cyclo-ligase [Solirubrobacteraceae bacterium]
MSVPGPAAVPAPAPDDLLLTIPNVSEGRDPAVIGAIGEAFSSTGARLLDVHSDRDHHRSVYTLAGDTRTIVSALVAGARACAALVDLRAQRGSHPHVGALDVAPLVYLDPARRGAACAAALVAGEELGRIGLPVFLYGELAGGRSRAQLRRGGLPELTQRIEQGDLQPDFGPARPDPRTGATLVGARPPLVAFNVELAPPATLADARAIAALIREGGAEGLPGVRAIGVDLAARGHPVAQVSANVEDHGRTSLAELAAAVARHAPVAGCELVGLAPRAAFDGFPVDVPVANRRTIEDALSS